MERLGTIHVIYALRYHLPWRKGSHFPEVSLRGDTVVETGATLKVVSTRVKFVLTYLKVKKAALLSLPWTQVAILIQMEQYFFIATLL